MRRYQNPIKTGCVAIKKLTKSYQDRVLRVHDGVKGAVCRCLVAEPVFLRVRSKDRSGKTLLDKKEMRSRPNSCFGRFFALAIAYCQKIAPKTSKSTVRGRSGWSRSCFRPRTSSATWCFFGSCLLWRPRASSFACSTCPEPLILAFSRRKNDKMVGRRHK